MIIHKIISLSVGRCEIVERIKPNIISTRIEELSHMLVRTYYMHIISIFRDSIFISVLDTFTSLMAGTTIFGILGNLAFKLNVNVSDVINSGGTGLAFISYPEAIARFDVVPWVSKTRKLHL